MNRFGASGAFLNLVTLPFRLGMSSIALDGGNEEVWWEWGVQGVMHVNKMMLARLSSFIFSRFVGRIL